MAQQQSLPPTFGERLTAATEGFLNGTRSIKVSRESSTDAAADVESAAQRMVQLEATKSQSETDLQTTIDATKGHRDSLVVVLNEWDEDTA